MSTDLLSVLADELAKLFEPVIDVVENPQLLPRLLASIGAESDAVGGDALANALSAVAALVEDIQQLATKPSRTFDDVGAVLAASQKAFDALRALGKAGSPADQIEHFGLDLADFLATSYLMRWHPLARQIAALLTLIEPEEAQDLYPAIVVDGKVVRSQYRIDRFHLNRIADLLRDPVGTLRAAYVTPLLTVADANAMADKLFPRVRDLLLALEVACRYGFRPGDEPLLGDAAPLVDHALVVWAADKLLGATEEAGVVFTLSPAERGDLGLLASPFGALQVQTTAGAWAIELDVTAGIQGVAYGRHGVTLLASPGTLQATANFTATLGGNDRGPGFMLGSPNSSRLEVDGAKVSAAVALSEARQDLAFSAEVSKAAIVIMPGDGDGFLRRVLPAGGLHGEFDLGIEWSDQRGVSFHGAAGLEAIFPVGISIGGVLRVPLIYVGLRANEAGLQAEVSAAVGLSIGPVQVVLDRLGVVSNVSFPKNGGNAGPADLSFDFKPPSGAGLSIDTAGVSGGGFLTHDATKHEYAGVLQLEYLDLALAAFGLITTQVAGGGYSLLALIDANFPPVQLGWGFTLNGVGGLLALHRTASVDALRVAVKADTLSSILFPKNAIANAASILGLLDTVFPIAPGRFLFGPMAQIGWGTPTVLTASLALIVELPQPIRLLLLARLTVLLPTPSEALVNIKMDALGVLDLGKSEFALDASLYDSHLLSFSLSGDMALRANWGSQREFLLAIGGFHPRFVPPAGFPALKRITIDMPSGSVSTLRLRSYLAVTSNTLQFGASLDVFIGVSGFGLAGHLSFDALLQMNPFHFDADISGSVALTAGGDNLMSVGLDATLSGPAPWHIAGKFKFSILFWDVHISFSQTWGVEASSEPVATVDVAQLLGTALGDVRNWGVRLANGVPALVSARNIDTPGLVAHPLAQLEAHEQIVPLGLDITRFGAAIPAGARRFNITAVAVGGSGMAREVLEDDFAPAQFFELSDEQKLARPSFERHDAGVRFGFGIGTGQDRPVKSGRTQMKQIAYEASFVDTPDGTIRPPAAPLVHGVIEFVLAGGAADRAVMLRAGRRKYSVGRRGITVAEPRYVVVDSNTLTVVNVGAAGGDTYSNQWEALRGELGRSPQRRDQLELVALHEVGV